MLLNCCWLNEFETTKYLETSTKTNNKEKTFVNPRQLTSIELKQE
jgi:hypothetical protein